MAQSQYALNSESRKSITPKAGWFRFVLRVLLIGILFFLGYWGWLKLNDPNTLPFKTIRVIATYQHVSPKQIKTVVSQNLNGGFFSLDISHLKEKVMQLPWVANVAVRRIWPATLMLTINEKKPIARWRDNQVVDSDGDIFKVAMKSISSRLPALMGPNDSLNLVLEKFHRFTQLLSSIHLRIVSITLSQRGAWQMQLSNGIKVIIGHDDVDQRFREFVRLYPKLIGSRWQEVNYVDLRYPNGLAIRWAG